MGGCLFIDEAHMGGLGLDHLNGVQPENPVVFGLGLGADFWQKRQGWMKCQRNIPHPNSKTSSNMFGQKQRPMPVLRRAPVPGAGTDLDVSGDHRPK